MFVVLLTFSTNKALAGQYMDQHNAWIQRGLTDQVFLLIGSLQPKRGGAIIAYNISLEDLQQRLDQDPFVVEKVVDTEIIEISPAKTDKRLQFLLTE